MEKGLDFFDTWVKSQREFLDNWMKSQKEFMENWMESVEKLRQVFPVPGGSPEGMPAKGMIDFYNSWLTTMISSSKTFTDEAVKVQETWKDTVEKQMEMSREMAKNYFNLLKQGGMKQ